MIVNDRENLLMIQDLLSVVYKSSSVVIEIFRFETHVAGHVKLDRFGIPTVIRVILR